MKIRPPLNIFLVPAPSIIFFKTGWYIFIYQLPAQLDLYEDKYSFQYEGKNLLHHGDKLFSILATI